MVTNVVILSQHEVLFSTLGDLALQPIDFQEMRLNTESNSTGDAHVVLGVVETETDVAWVREAMTRFSSTPIRVILGNRRMSALTLLLAKQLQALGKIEDLSEDFLTEVLLPLITRVDELYHSLFTQLDRTQKGYVDAEDLIARNVETSIVQSWLAEGGTSRDRVTREEFVSWWKSTRSSLSAFRNVLAASSVLDLCGKDLRAMLLRTPDSEEERRIQGKITVGEVSDAPQLQLKLRVDATSDTLRSIVVTFTLLTRENVDVATEKASLKDAISEVLGLLKPLDREGSLMPHLQLSYSSDNRKVVVTLTIATTEGELKEMTDWLCIFVVPHLQSSFAQYLDLTLKSDVTVQSMAEDAERSYFECLSESFEIQGNGCVWAWYQQLFTSLVASSGCSSEDSFLLMALNALCGATLNLQFGSVEELPSFVLGVIHAATERHGFLSLFRVKEFLHNASHELVVAGMKLLTLLAAKFDSKHIAAQAKFLNVTVSAELIAPDLFQAIVC